MNIDEELVKVENLAKITPQSAGIPGTMVMRTLADVSIMKNNDVVPHEDHITKGYGLIWVLGIGALSEAKKFFYGHTIEECILKAGKYLESQENMSNE